MTPIANRQRFFHNREIAPVPTWERQPLLPIVLNDFSGDHVGVSDTSWQIVRVRDKILGSYAITRSFRLPAELEFWNLAVKWKQDTIWDSSVTKKVMHPAYQRIIGMGPVAVPFILKALRSDPDFWFEALLAITGEQPIPEGHAGDIEAMANDWLAWGRREGYEC